MKDSNCIQICERLDQSGTLKVLNLSKNGLTCKSAASICKVIYSTETLVSLFIRYNQILSKGGNMLAQHLQDNTTVQIFDISFNSIAGGIVLKDEK